MNKLRTRPATLVPPPLVYAVGLGCGWWLQHRWPLGGHPPVWLQHIAEALLIASVGLMLWAAITIWRHNTTVNPYGSVTRLVTSGPFSLSRNPIYLADAVAYAALTVLLGSLWPLLFVPLVWATMHYGVIMHEERYLTDQFGEDYRAYTSRVKRWIGRAKLEHTTL